MKKTLKVSLDEIKSESPMLKYQIRIPEDLKLALDAVAKDIKEDSSTIVRSLIKSFCKSKGYLK